MPSCEGIIGHSKHGLPVLLQNRIIMRKIAGKMREEDDDKKQVQENEEASGAQ
jgi:hypothetical protein